MPRDYRSLPPNRVRRHDRAVEDDAWIRAFLHRAPWGVLATVVWCAIATFVLLKIIDALMGLRVSKETEVDGLDLNLHGEVVP